MCGDGNLRYAEQAQLDSVVRQADHSRWCDVECWPFATLLTVRWTERGASLDLPNSDGVYDLAVPFGVYMGLRKLATGRTWCAEAMAGGRCQGDARSSAQGLMIAIPQCSKSAALRVATAASLARAMEAIWQSASRIGRPTERREAAIAA